jgi:hypothetical protein
MCLLVAAGHSAETLIAEVRRFSLGPGESAFCLPFAQFDPGAYAEPLILREVTVTLTAVFAGEMTLFNSTASSVRVTGSLGNARVRATPRTAGLLVPAAVELGLSAVATVPAAVLPPHQDSGDGEVSLTPTADGSVSTLSTEVATLARYTGTGEVGYDIDFTALYSQRVTTRPSAVGALVCNERMTGTLTLTYRAAAPAQTGAVLESLSAVALDSNRRVVHWRTDGEANLLGFLLDRRIAAGAWVRVTPALVPAVGSGRAESYQFEDALPADSRDVRYRLLQVDRHGETTPLGETSVVRAPRADITFVGASLRLSVTGEPNSQPTVATTLDAVRGPWIYMGSVPLDGGGAGTVLLPLSFDCESRFYRLIVQ